LRKGNEMSKVLELVEEMCKLDYVGAVKGCDPNVDISTKLLVEAVQYGKLDVDKTVSFDNDVNWKLWSELDDLGLIGKMEDMCRTAATFEAEAIDDEEEIKYGDGIAMWECMDGAVTSFYLHKEKLLELIMEAENGMGN